MSVIEQPGERKDNLFLQAQIEMLATRDQTLLPKHDPRSLEDHVSDLSRIHKEQTSVLESDRQPYILLQRALLGLSDEIAQDQTREVDKAKAPPSPIPEQSYQKPHTDLRFQNTLLKLYDEIKSYSIQKVDNTEVSLRPIQEQYSQQSHADTHERLQSIGLPGEFNIVIWFQHALLGLYDEIKNHQTHEADKVDKAETSSSSIEDQNDSLVEDLEPVKFIVTQVKPDEVMVVLKNDSASSSKSSGNITLSKPQYIIIPVYSEADYHNDSVQMKIHFSLNQEDRLNDFIDGDTPQTGHLPFSLFTVASEETICVFITVQNEKTCVDIIVKEEQKSCIGISSQIILSKNSKGGFSKKSLKSIANTIFNYTSLSQRDHENEQSRSSFCKRKSRSSLSTNVSSFRAGSLEDIEEPLKKDQECQTDVEAKPGKRENGAQTEPIVIDPPKEIIPREAKPVQYKPLLYIPKGLINIGNTCYMNATLQCLLSTRKLFTFFTDKSEISKIPKGQKQLAWSFIWLANYIRNVGSVPGNWLSNIKQLVSVLNEDFADSGQKDASEFFSTVLDGLNDELNRVKEKPLYKQLKTEPRINIQEMSKEWFSYMRSSKNSIITDTFTGQLFNKTICLACKKEKFSFQDFQSLSLSFKGCNSANKGVHLEKMLEKFSQEETSDDYWCGNCDGETTCRTRTIIWRLPPILVIHLKRFDSNGRRYRKIDIPVTFPIESFNISRFVRESEDISVKDAEYSLFATVNHHGSLNGGHYTATCWDLKEKIIYECSDTRILRNSRWEPVSCTLDSPLMLFYIKKCHIVEELC